MDSVKPPTVESEQPPGVVKRAITASAIGNATEWFDYGIYAYGVSYIAESIFPGDAASATLLAFMTFAVSFLVRPIGGVVPPYSAIGLWAPVLMVVLRMIQGFSTGGEYGGAATFMAENAPRGRGKRGRFAAESLAAPGGGIRRLSEAPCRPEERQRL
jgi:MFS family permease